jgi:hypothetical protein
MWRIPVLEALPSTSRNGKTASKTLPCTTSVSLYSHRQMIEKHKPLCTDAQAFRKERLPIGVKQQRNKLRLCLWGNIAIWKLSSIGQPLEARDLEDYYVVMGGEAPQSAAWVARLCCLFRFDGQGFEKLGSESKGSRAWLEGPDWPGVGDCDLRAPSLSQRQMSMS